MVKKLFIPILLLLLFTGCASVKPMELKPYHPPDLSKIVRPQIPKLIDGEDYFINEKGNIEYTLTGQNKITAKILSEKLGWESAETMKGIVEVQGEMMRRYQEWIIELDMKRQQAVIEKRYSDAKAIFAEILAIVAMVLILL